MSDFRGPFFRQSQTDYCASISEPPPRRGFDQHNPPGSMFREEQTLHIYGTLRFRQSEPEPTLPLPPHPAPQIETPEPLESEAPATYQANEFLSFDLSHVTSRRLCIMGATRLIEHAAKLDGADGFKDSELRPYSKRLGTAHSRFDRTIKPKSPLAFLREKLFDD